MKLKHINLNARDAERLAEFYRQVFGFTVRGKPRRLSGEVVSRGNGLQKSDIYSIWLQMNQDDGPFLEIMQYTVTVERTIPAVNATGYGHLAFEVPDLKKCVNEVLRFGGSLQGETVNFGTEEKPFLIVYVRDPEGNILELEQHSAS